jgi:hypothetical protein
MHNNYYTFFIDFCSYTMGFTMWHSLTPTRHVYETEIPKVAHEKLETLQSVPFLRKLYLQRHILNYSSWIVQCSEYTQQLISEEFHLHRIILFKYYQYSLLNIITGTGKLFKTPYIMQKCNRPYMGTLTRLRETAGI